MSSWLWSYSIIMMYYPLQVTPPGSISCDQSLINPENIVFNARRRRSVNTLGRYARQAPIVNTSLVSQWLSRIHCQVLFAVHDCRAACQILHCVKKWLAKSLMWLAPLQYQLLYRFSWMSVSTQWVINYNALHPVLIALAMLSIGLTHAKPLKTKNFMWYET